MFVVLLMMVLLVVGCTVEVVGIDEVVEIVSTDEENINVSNSDIINEVGTNEVGILVGRGIIDEVVGTFELLATVNVVRIFEVVDIDEVDIINGTDIVDEVVNTVDVSDTDDE